MTNDELKKKIVDIIRYCYVNEKDYGYIFDLHIEEKINAIADALIAAGIGDIREAEHRAEVAERAIRIYQTQYGDVRFFNFDVAIRQAEKELKENE